MIARLRILLPFAIAMPEKENLPLHAFDRGPYHVRVHPPYRAILDPHEAELRSTLSLLEIAENLSPSTNPPADEIVQVNGVPTYDANVLQIEFTKDEFDRSRRTNAASNQGLPLAELGFEVANEFLQTLRTMVRASAISFLGSDRTYWELAYFSNDGKLLDSHPDFIRRTVVASQRWRWCR